MIIPNNMKITYKYMRSATMLLAVAAAFVVAGCQTEIRTDVSKSFSDGQLTIEGTLENPYMSTKTVCDETGAKVYWTPGDAISLFYGSGDNGGSKFTSTLKENALRSAFTGNIGAVTGVGEVTADELMFWGLYPYDASSSCDGSSVMVNLLPQQEGMAGTFASGMAPTLGRAPGLLLSFKNIYSTLRFTVSEAGFQSLTLRTNGGEFIAGRAKVGWVSDVPTVLEFESGKATNEVTVTAPTSAGFEPNKKYYLLLYPQTMASGFTVEIKSASKVGTYVVSSSIKFNRSKYRDMEGIDSRQQTTWTDISGNKNGQSEPFVNGGNGKWD